MKYFLDVTQHVPTSGSVLYIHILIVDDERFAVPNTSGIYSKVLELSLSVTQNASFVVCRVHIMGFPVSDPLYTPYAGHYTKYHVKYDMRFFITL